MCLAAEEVGVPQVVPIQLSEIESLSSVRIYIAKDLRQTDSKALGLKVSKFSKSSVQGCLKIAALSKLPVAHI